VTGLAGALALGAYEMVSVVGGGGKTTMVFGLAEEAVSRGLPAVVTTSTKMGVAQTGGLPTVAGDEPMPADGMVRWVGDVDGHRVTGRAPAELDACFAGRSGWVLVEADGSRQRPVKAPAPYEPVIPLAATVVVACTGMDAVGGRIADVAHRPELVAEVLGVDSGDVLTPAMVADLVVHPDGGRRAVPLTARFVVALTKVEDDRREPAHRIAEAVMASPLAPERVVLVPPPGGSPEVLVAG